MSNYYVYVQNQVQGPFSLNDVVAMLKNGSINYSTQISCGKGTPWQQISNRPEILVAMGQAPGQAAMPGSAPMMQGSAPMMQGSAPMMQGSAPMMQGMQNVQPAVQAVRPVAQAVPPVVQAVPPVVQAVPPVVQAVPPVVQAVPPVAQAVRPVVQAVPPVVQAVPPVQKQEEEFVYFCPRCNQKFAGEASWEGREVICTTCNEIFIAGSNELMPDLSAEGDLGTIDWENSTGDIICPHCWLHFGSEHLLSIASHPSLVGDAVLGSMAQKRFSPTKFNALGQALDAMSYACTDVACPRCHLKIPQTLIEENSLYFSIVGTHSSGKSYYLATLLHTLRQKLANEFARSLIDVDPEMNTVLDSYEETLFRPVKANDVAVLPKTQREGEKFVNTVVLDNMPVNLPKPFVFELKNLNSSLSHEDCNIIFYDNAGEHFQPGGDDVTNPGTRHLSCSSGIIFIFDPVNDAIMRQHCNNEDPQLHSDVNVYDQSKLMSEIVSRIRRHSNISANDKCSIPLVIGVGKYDTWRDIFPRDIASLQTLSYNHNDFSTSWNRNTIIDVSFEVRELMLEYAPAVVNTAEGFFEKVIYVPFSNFGCLATLDHTGQAGVIPRQINPLWPEQLFLALLAENGKLPVTPTPAGENYLQTQILDDFIVFRHPVKGSVVRLPWFYANATLTIGGQTYQLPNHPKFEKNTVSATVQPDSGNDDLWS